MWKNYFKIAYRNLWKNKTYSTINILGLTLGITCSSLLFMLVIDEFSFDGMYDKKDRLYRLIEVNTTAEETREFGMVPGPTGKTLSDEYAEIENYTRLYKFGGQIVFQHNEEAYQERDYYFAEDNFFELFNLEWIAGDPATALQKPFAVVIDEEWALRLFGTTEALGKTLDSGGDTDFLVTGVIKKLPQNSHIQYKILVGLPTDWDFYKEIANSWDRYGAYTYLLLQENAKPESIHQKMKGFVANHFEDPQQHDFYLQPLSDIHFNSAGIEYASDTNRGQITYAYIFMAIGFFMLLIACINYMNLATAKSLHRGKEIGIRKVSGAFRHQLVSQFLSESVLFAFIALILSVFLVDLLLPYFNELTNKQFVFNVETFGSIFFLIFSITIIVGLLSGSYPAILMSRLKPTSILKGAMKSSKSSVVLRKVLVSTQFTLSIIMIIATIVAYRQLNYVQNVPLGFENEQMLIVDINSGEVRERFETIKSEFANSPYVEGVAVSSRVPGEWKSIQEVYTKNFGSADSMKMNYIGFDADMINLYKMQLIEGENFTGNNKTDSLHIIINETAAQILNLDDPIGKFLELSDDGISQQLQIAGVVKDFNFQSLHNKVGPMILGYRANAFQSIDYFSLKFNAEHTEEVLAHAEEVHKIFDTRSSMEYHFLDEQWAAFYKEDRRVSNVFAIGGGVTIFIACLGLFGLASFVIQQRTKEIGIRKVLGAEVTTIVGLLSKDFLKLILISILIAVPISWYAMDKWLQDFAYRVDVSWWIFAGSGLIVMVFALFTISFQSLKVAYTNPVDSLKRE
ncbi:ABC transporter permease [Marivirga sp. S37H4]|uniref:ABC transporter permease n=1 Tax=Marivirga aurantiaca TaxID=2802615 RepID=A0A934X105_9BACT|nr:ABC transporter permease [Marivirga aurantiaca]MBK6266360.1 ABC transporter permease [Marivirga aurantiaca]